MCTRFYFAHKLSSKHELSGGARWVLFYRNWAKKTSSGGRGEGSQGKVKNEVNADTHVREVVCGRGELINAAPHREKRDYGGTGTAKERWPFERQSWRRPITDSQSGGLKSQAALRDRRCQCRPAPTAWLSCGLCNPPARASPCELTPGEERGTRDAAFKRRSRLYVRSRNRK